MIVATFNATTGWAGKNITWQDDRLVLDGHGVITTADVMEYDRQGHLDWPSEEMRSWAATRLSWEQAVAAPEAASATATAATTTTATPVTPTTPSAPITPTTDAHHPFVAETAVEEPVTAEEPGTTHKPAEPVAADEEVAADETAPEAAGIEAAAAAVEAAPAAEAAADAETAPLPSDEVYDVLAPGGDIAELVGTAPYQDTLRVIAGDTPESAPELEKWAHLIPEPDNPWDRNAVAVYIDAHKIGYLPRESSAAYAALLTQLWANARARVVCRAVVTGGSFRVTTQAGSVAEVDDEQFGVKLALAAPQHFDVTRELQRLTAEELAEGPPPILSRAANASPSRRSVV
jgi:hypothetical protein